MNLPTKVTLAISASAILFAGCSKKNDETDKAPTETPETATKTAASTEPPATPPEAKPEVRNAEAVVASHLAAFGARDMEAVLADYADDAILMTPGGTLKGKDQIKPAFAGMFAEFAKPGAKFELKKQVFDGDIGFISWTGDTADNTYDFATDTFIIRDGKIVAQTFTPNAKPKAAPADAEAPKAATADAAKPTGPTADVLGRHLESFGKGDVAGLVADYAADAKIITAMGTLEGTDAIKGLFDGMTAEFAKPGMKFEMKHMTVEGDVAYFVWSGETADNTYELAADTLIIVDGKIKTQTFDAKVTPKTAK